MATWQEFVDFISETYPIYVFDEDSIRIDMQWGDGRSHYTAAHLVSLEPSGIWLLSPVCSLEAANAEGVLDATRRQSCPIGVVKTDFGYSLSLFIPLEFLNGDEAIARVRWITELADEVEKDLLQGGDAYTANIGDGPSTGAGPTTGEARFCGSCGTARVPGAAFCGNCGSALG